MHENVRERRERYLKLGRLLLLCQGFPRPPWLGRSIPIDNPHREGDGVLWRQDPEDLKFFVPDLDDPATRGWMLDAIRKLYQDPTIHMVPETTQVGWSLISPRGRIHSHLLDEAELLVDAWVRREKEGA